MGIPAILVVWASFYFTFITAALIPRQTLPSGHFFVQATSTDPTVNGKFAFFFGSGGNLFIGPQINHQGT
jgi:hypothetical protein